MNDELPQGWTEATLEKAGTWRSGGTPSRRRPEFFGKGVPWVKSGDLPDGPILKTEEEITKLGLQNSSAKLMPPGTVSMALYGATIGKLGVMTCPAATNQACANVIPDKSLVDPKYLFYYLLSERRKFIEQGQGGAQPNISQEIVRAHPFRLAPLAEQQRILTKLEKLLSQVDACQARLAKIPALLKRFRRSVLAAACSGRLTEDWREERKANTVEEKAGIANSEDTSDNAGLYEIPTSWRWVKLEDICDDITVGHVGPMLKEYRETGIPFLRSQNVREFRFDSNGLKFISRQFHQSLEKSALTPGDVVVVRSGNAGVACVIPESLPAANCADLVIIRPRREVNAHFVCIFINSDSARAHVDEVKVGIAQSHFNIGAARKTPFPMPPQEEQQKLVRRVDKLFALADQIEARFAEAKKRVDSITQSVLAKAFRGELVPTEYELAKAEGRNFESAEELLERVKQNGGELSKKKAKPQKGIRSEREFKRFTTKQ